jgi:phage gp29-like protein
MAARAIEAGEDWWAAYPEADLKLLQAWGLILGVGLARQSWVEHGERIIPRIVVHSPRNLRWDWTSRQWYLTVADEDAPGTSTHEIEIDPTSGEWILYTPYSGTAQRPWQYGAWRALARPVAAKVYARRDFASYSERLGQGVWLVTGATGPQQKEAISADLASLGRNASLAIDAGFDLKLIESTARTWEAFQRQIELCDLAIAITLLGQNLTTENTGGSQAATSEHGRVALAKTKADAETLSTCLHDQSLTWWAMFNFGSPEAAPWPVWRTTPAADLKDMAGTLQMLSQAVSTLTAARAPVDVRALLAQYQIPLLDVPPPVDAPEPGTPDPTPEVEPSAPEASPSSTPSPEVTTP